MAVAGSIIGLGSLLFGWLTLKPNRIASGLSRTLWDIPDNPLPAILVLLWAIALCLSLAGKKQRAALALGVTANGIVGVTLFYAGSAAEWLLMPDSTGFARVSLGTGFWVSLAGAYFVIFGTRYALKENPVRRHLVTWAGPLLIVVFLLSGQLNNLSLIQEFTGREERFVQELLRHVALFGGSVLAGTLLGILLGIWATRSRRAERPIFYFANITQTIPSLALFGILIAPLSALSFSYPFLRDLGIRGVGAAPAVIALVIYSLLPIVRNTYTGLKQVDPAVIDAGLGMGMSRGQIFRRIEIPLARPIILEGVRIASVQSVGLTAVAALIGAGGLGWFIFRGVGQAANDLILLGAIPIIVLALIVDGVMRIVIRLGTPKGIAGGQP